MIVLFAMLVTAQAMDMRGLKARNKAYLERTQQTKHKPFNDEQYMASLGKVSRRHLSALGMEENAESYVAAARQLNYFNESRWEEADPWVNPGVGSTNSSECPGLELYGQWGTSYICPVATQVDCQVDADQYASVDANGNPISTEGTWNRFPTALRGNWDESDYWTVPIPMGKFINDFEEMCENREVFTTVVHPVCIPTTVEMPFATMCVFNRIYRFDYNALWYMWYAWSQYSDSAETVTRAANIESDGMVATTALYQARIFIPQPGAAARRRALLQEAADTEDENLPELTEAELALDIKNILAAAAKGGDLEALQNALDTTTLGASPSLVFPPPAPALWGQAGNSTNSTEVA